MGELYQRALDFYRQGNYEEAFELLDRITERDRDETALLRECNNQIIQQYVYLIKDAVSQSNFQDAINLKNEYNTKYGLSTEINQIDIPDPVPQIDPLLKEEKIDNGEPEILETKLENTGSLVSSKANSRLFYWIGGVIVVLLIVASIYKFMVQKNKDQSINVGTVSKSTNLNENEKDVQEDYKEIMAIIENWNYVHNTSNYASSAAVEQLYTSTVKFYGQAVTAKECVDLFYRTLKKYDSFSQKIKGEVSFTKLSDGSVRCDFVKEVQTDGTCKDYEAYLVFKKEDNWWYISEESDKITDAYFEKRKAKNSTYLDEIKSNPNNHVMTVYSTENSWVYYWSDSDGNILYRRNLGTGETNKLASLDQDFMMYLVDTFYIHNNRYLDIKGNNNSNSFMNRDIVCRIDMNTGESRELLMGSEITRTQNQYVVFKNIIIPSDKSSAESDYFPFEQYYNLDGVLIDGKTISGDGYIGKYPIHLFLYSYKNMVKGFYQYEGHTNHMTFSGELIDDRVFEATEYNEYKQPGGVFKGKIDFDNQWMTGVWENKDGTKQLEFEVRRE